MTGYRINDSEIEISDTATVNEKMPKGNSTRRYARLFHVTGSLNVLISRCHSDMGVGSGANIGRMWAPRRWIASSRSMRAKTSQNEQGQNQDQESDHDDGQPKAERQSRHEN